MVQNVSKVDSEWRFGDYPFQYAVSKNAIKFLDFVQGHRKNKTLTFLELLLPLEYHIVVDVWWLVKKEVHEVDRETYGRWTFNH